MSAAELVIAVASTALFDLAEGDGVYRAHGQEAYRAWQREREDVPPPAGVAFPFIRRLLTLADAGASIEVVLLSRNDPDTGVRVRNALEHYRLGIRRSAFTGGRAPWQHLRAFGAHLFLSGNRADVSEALRLGFAAGVVLPSVSADDDDPELRIAFDFDGVLADDQSEQVYHRDGLAAYRLQEAAAHDRALTPGPLHPFLERLARVQAAGAAIRTAIVTARSAPADRRVVASLRAWGIRVDEAFFVGDMAKDRLLSAFRPHLFFDDKPANADLAAGVGPAVHVPFGVLNHG